MVMKSLGVPLHKTLAPEHALVLLGAGWPVRREGCTFVDLRARLRERRIAGARGRAMQQLFAGRED